jgi:hypothetical protein
MRASESLHNDETALRRAVDTTPAFIHAGRPDGYLDYFNRGWLDFLGRSLEEVCGWKWTESIHPEDVEAVATKLLALSWNALEQQWNSIAPPLPRDFVRVIVGYALTCKLRLPAVANTIEEARYQARKHNRSHLLASDLRAALLNYRIPSDAALQRAFEARERLELQARPAQAHLKRL